MARTSVVPDAIDALVSILTAALTCRVVDGYDLSGEATDMIEIGVDDPNSPVWANVATSQQNWAGATKQGRDEIADVMCAAISFNGNSDAKAARDAVYAMSNAVADTIRANHTLGVSGVWKTNFGASSKLTQILNDDGAVAILVFSIQVFARI